MPLNSTQHYSHTELTDFCETFLLIFNCCRRRRGGGRSYTPGISPFSIFAVRLTKKAIEVRRGGGGTQPHLTCWLLTPGMGRRQMCFLCISSVWIVSLKSAPKLLSEKRKLINSGCSGCPSEPICKETLLFLLVDKISWYSRVQIVSAFRWDV